jgi:UDP:flavonoid glycosyltransferase YjiC (YdhE family)
MKLLFSTRPAHGHVYPLMPLAEATRRAGHEVVFATAGAFVRSLRGLGFPTVEVGLTFEEAYARLDAFLDGRMPRDGDGRPDLESGGRLFVDVFGAATAADLAVLLPDLRPDVVVYEQYDFGAAIAATAARVPAILHSLSPRMPQGVIDVAMGDRLTALWADHGVDATSFDVHTGELYLDIVPSVLQEPSVVRDPARVRLRPIPYAPPGAAVPEWIERGERPLAYVTLGTVVATDDVLRPAIAGVADLDVDVLVALGSAAGVDLGMLPPNVHVVPFVDQTAVLARAGLVVHHGGSGTMLATSPVRRSGPCAPSSPRCRRRTRLSTC